MEFKVELDIKIEDRFLKEYRFNQKDLKEIVCAIIDNHNKESFVLPQIILKDAKVYEKK